MASVVIDPIADRIKAVLDALVSAAYWPPVAMPDALPAAVVQPPTVRRVAPEDGESQMGADDWRIDFSVSAYFDLADTGTAQTAGVEFFEAFVSAVDNDPTLAGTVLDAKVTTGSPDYDRISERRPVFIYECTVETFCLVQ
jgi:hypothetical protein